ncbi:hypothetical protein MMC21_008136 [Puttea exsequens]|nr:hypothetical protein [Puttea exsequens]
MLNRTLDTVKERSTPLEDYQMQLMLLDQKSKERLLLARQEPKSVTNQTPQAEVNDRGAVDESDITPNKYLRAPNAVRRESQQFQARLIQPQSNLAQVGRDRHQELKIKGADKSRTGKNKVSKVAGTTGRGDL